MIWNRNSIGGPLGSRRSRLFALPRLLALAWGGLYLIIGASAQASLLVYEPFNYASGTVSGSGVLLSGQNGGVGMTGTWNVATTGSPGTNSATVYTQGTSSLVNSSAGVVNSYVGVVANLPTSGGYMGSKGLSGTAVTTDHLKAWRALDPSVTAAFTDGATTWLSYVSVRAFNSNAAAPKLAIGAAELLEDRGHIAAGEAIGFGGGLGSNAGSNTSKLFGQMWDQAVDGVGNFQNYDPTGLQALNSASTTPVPATDYFAWDTTSFGAINILIAKITWHDSTPDIISYAKFAETDSLTEANFNAIAKSSSTWATQRNLNQSQFDTISLEGARYFVDELRLGTTFNDVVGVVPVPEPGTITLAVLATGLIVPWALRYRGKGRDTSSHLLP